MPAGPLPYGATLPPPPLPWGQRQVAAAESGDALPSRRNHPGTGSITGSTGGSAGISSGGGSNSISVISSPISPIITAAAHRTGRAALQLARRRVCAIHPGAAQRPPGAPLWRHATPAAPPLGPAAGVYFAPAHASAHLCPDLACFPRVRTPAEGRTWRPAGAHFAAPRCLHHRRLGRSKPRHACAETGAASGRTATKENDFGG